MSHFLFADLAGLGYMMRKRPDRRIWREIMVVERNKNDNVKSLNADAAGGKGGKNQQSTIEFPYSDLDDAVEVAKTIAANAGISCTIEQLAAYLDKAVSGPFRVLLSNVRMFGVTKNEKGELHLTELGRMLTDPKTEAAARVQAFLSVPLYKAIYEKYRRFTLPGSAGLEREIQALGVSSKQVSKARQVFARSAKQAGFFAHGDDRLVMPAVGALPLTKPIAPQGSGTQKENMLGGNGGGGGEDHELDPLLVALLKKIPSPEKGWPAAQRIRWFRTFAMNVSQIYDPEDDPVEMKITTDGQQL